MSIHAIGLPLFIGEFLIWVSMGARGCESLSQRVDCFQVISQITVMRRIQVDLVESLQSEHLPIVVVH